MFTVVLYMVKHRLLNDSFADLLQLIADSGSDDMKKHLSGMAKNATYMSLESFTDVLKAINEYVENPILKVADGKLFTIFIDETTSVDNKSVANVYIKKGLNIENVAFSEMDGCATNQGRRKGLKKYFSFHNPHHISESCGSHKIALLPKKLVVEGPYNCLQEADSIAVGLSAFFKDSSLRSAILQNTQNILKQKVLKLISPASTRWLSHLDCSVRLLQVLPSVLPALNSIYTDRDDIKALGFLLAIIRPDFLLSCLALHDVFKAMSLLIHWLQTAPRRADITRVPVLVRETVVKLHALAGEDSENWKEEERRMFTFAEFSNLNQTVNEFVKSTPIAGNSRSRRGVDESEDMKNLFYNFKEEVFVPFAKDMAENVELSLQTHPVCQAFGCLDQTWKRSEPFLEQKLIVKILLPARDPRLKGL